MRKAGTPLPLYPLADTARAETESEVSAEEIGGGLPRANKAPYLHRLPRRVTISIGLRQPDPFRRYEGAPLIRLPFPESGKHFRIGSSMLRAA